MKTLTEGGSHARLTKPKMNRLILQEHLSPADVSGFNEAQRKKIKMALVKKLQTTAAKDQVAVLEKIALVSNDPGLKSDVWEINHSKVKAAITAYLTEHGCLPNQLALVQKTGLCRQTISMHLKEYHNQPSYSEHLEQLKLMKMTVLEQVLAHAVSGDLKAAKMFLDTVDKTRDKTLAAAPNTIKQQNNYIQVNGVVISEEKLGRLSPEQLRQIETIFNGPAPYSNVMD